jgi:hypothetical protein
MLFSGVVLILGLPEQFQWLECHCPGLMSSGVALLDFLLMFFKERAPSGCLLCR